MADNGDRKTPADGLAAEAVRKQSSGSLKAVRVPPRADSALDPDPVLQARGVNGRYRGITPSDSDRPLVTSPAIPELPKEIEEQHPRFDRAPREKTWDVVPPELIANSPGLRAIEAYSRDGSKRAQQGRTETRELRAEFQEFKANNAQEHLGIHEKQVETNNRLTEVQKALPKAARSGRAWGFAMGAAAAVVAVAGAIAAWYSYEAARETADAARETAAATREQAAATREMIRATASAIPAH